MLRRRGNSQTSQWAIVRMPNEADDYPVKFGIPESVAWERANKGKPYADGSGAVHMERSAWCVWAAARKAGKTEAKDLNVWLAEIDEIELLPAGESPYEDEDGQPDEEADPTPGVENS